MRKQFVILRYCFLSPARRGRGILVAPGFRQASRFLVGAKTTGQFFLNFNMTFLATWGCARATKIQNGRQRSTPKFFVGTKTLKLKSEIIQILRSHSPQYGDVQVTFSRFFMKFKMAATDQL